MKGPYALKKRSTLDNRLRHDYIPTVNMEQQIEQQTFDMNENIDQDVFEDTEDPLALTTTVKIRPDKKRLKPSINEQQTSNEIKTLKNDETNKFECSYWDEEDLFTINENEKL